MDATTGWRACTWVREAASGAYYAQVTTMGHVDLKLVLVPSYEVVSLGVFPSLGDAIEAGEAHTHHLRSEVA